MDDKTFSLGISYWPRRRSAGAEQILCSWSEADPGALRAELGHIAELGFDTVRLELRWAEAMPSTRVGAAALIGLERALDRANDAGLRAVVSTLSGSLAATLHLPDWAVGYRLPSDTLRARRLGPPVLIVPDDQPAILAGDRYRHEPPRDLYREAELLEAQRLLLHEAVGNLAQHPAAAAWVIGADVERLRRPSSSRAAAEWWGPLSTRAVELGARTVVGQLSPAALGRKEGLRPEQIAAAGGRVAVSAAALPPLPPSRPDDAEPIRFLHALAAALLKAEQGGDPRVLVAEVGTPTAAEGATGAVPGEVFGRPWATTLATQEQQATLVEDALAGLHRDGAGGVWLATYGDLHPGMWHVPPADRSWLARTAGIVTPDGREKPAAAAVRAFAARLRAGALPAPSGPPALPLDPERYWHDPAASLRALWREWFEAR